MSLKYMNRRHFLQGMGSTALAIPFLGSLAPSLARAAATPPRRVVFVYSLYGVFGNQFFPSVAADQQVANQFEMYYKLLKDIPGPMSQVLGTQFDSVRSKMNVFRGFEVYGQGKHNRTAFLSARCDGDHNAIKSSVPWFKTADVLIENSSKVYPTNPGLRALRMKSIGTDAMDSADACSWLRDNQGKSQQPFWDTSDTAAFSRVFPGGVPSGGSSPTPAPSNSSGQQLIADRLLDAYKSLMGNRRISSEDKLRLDEHVQRVHELNKATSSTPTQPTQNVCSVRSLSAYAPARPVRELYTNYIDLAVSALACNRTQVVCLFIPHFEDAYTFPRIQPGSSMTTAHIASHFYWWDQGERVEPSFSGDPFVAYANYYKWVSARVAELVTKLDSTLDSDGSRLLDNTLVVWGNENGEAPHTNKTHPIVTAGSMGGAFKTGYYFDFRARPLSNNQGVLAKSRGRPLTQLLVSVMQGMGLQPQEYLSEGDAGGFGGWAQDPEDPGAIDRANQKFGSARNSPLPFIFNG